MGTTTNTNSEAKMEAMRLEHTKIAIRRDMSYPVGQPASMHAVCVCRERIELPVGGPTGDFSCGSCGREFTPSGWVVQS
jgi:hypothetical protein